MCTENKKPTDQQEAQNPESKVDQKKTAGFPFYMKNIHEDTIENLEKIYSDDMDVIRYYLNKSYHINPGKLQKTKPHQQLRALHKKYRYAALFFQFLYTNLWTDELKILQQISYRYITDTNVSPKERAQVILTIDKLIEFFQKTLICRPLIGYLLWQHRMHEKKLRGILRIAKDDEGNEEIE